MSKKFRGRPSLKNKRSSSPSSQAGMMKQVQAMQAKMEESSAKLAEKEYTAQAGGGMVEIKINGDKKILELNIEKDVVDPEDVEMLEDLILAAYNDAFTQAEKESNELMSEMTGGLNIPGLF